MTLERLKTALSKIDSYYGRRDPEPERKARAEVYAYALRDVPDDVAMAALMRALTVCRYPSQLLVDWCAEIRKATSPPPDQLWNQTREAARLIGRDLDWAGYGGLLTSEGHVTPTQLRQRARERFSALPAAVQQWAGSPEELVSAVNRPAAELCQYVRPGFFRAMDTAAGEALALPGSGAQLERGEMQLAENHPRPLAPPKGEPRGRQHRD